MQFLNYINRKEAQVFMEYAIVLGIIVTILFAMTTMIRRGTQGMIKVVADQIGVQENSEQDFDSGKYLKSSYTTTRTALDERTMELLGATNYIFADAINVSSGTTINLGFSESSMP